MPFLKYHLRKVSIKIKSDRHHPLSFHSDPKYLTSVELIPLIFD